MNKFTKILFVISTIAILCIGAYIGGEISISHNNFSYSFSVFYLSVTIVAVLLLFRIIIKVYSYTSKRNKQSIVKLTDSLQEIISLILLKDHKKAQTAFNKLHKNVKKSPLGYWLRGHIQFLKGDLCDAKALFHNASAAEKNSSLGASSLYKLAVQSRDRALEADSINNIIEKSADYDQLSLRLLVINLLNKDFQKAYEVVEKITSNKKRLRSIAMYEEFCATGKINLELLKNAYQESSEIIPIAVEYVKVLLHKENTKGAKQSIEKTWKSSPHPDLFSMYIDLCTLIDEKIEAGYNLVTMNTDSWIGYFEFGKLLLDNNKVFDAYCNFIGAFGIYKGKCIYDLMYKTCLLLDDPKPQSAQEILNDSFVDDIIEDEICWQCSNCFAQSTSWHAICEHCEAIDTIQFGQYKPQTDTKRLGLQVL